MLYDLARRLPLLGNYLLILSFCYKLVSDLGVTCMEMGYWKQTSKSKNRFFNLNMDTIKEITQEQGKNNIAVMIDYHYCSKNLKDYPTSLQNEIKMIRMTARKDMIDDAYEFAVNLNFRQNARLLSRGVIEKTLRLIVILGLILVQTPMRLMLTL